MPYLSEVVEIGVHLNDADDDYEVLAQHISKCMNSNLEACQIPTDKIPQPIYLRQVIDMWQGDCIVM